MDWTYVIIPAQAVVLLSVLHYMYRWQERWTEAMNQTFEMRRKMLDAIMHEEDGDHRYLFAAVEEVRYKDHIDALVAGKDPLPLYSARLQQIYKDRLGPALPTTPPDLRIVN
jgi:hypothetical protein